jgi:Astacin (Peptidase family M12A)
MKNLVALIVAALSLAACSQSPDVPTMEVTELTNWHNASMESSNPQFTRATVEFPDGQRNDVDAYQHDGKLMYQGDLVLSEDGQAQTRAGIVTSRVWPNRTVYYSITSSMPQANKNNINRAVSYYNANTRVRWVARTTQRNYVRFVSGGGCSSYVGVIGGAQSITLASGCGYGATLHEMGHAVGFHHEQSRTDRDRYVTILYQNIPANWKSQFDIIGEAQPYGAYDFYSIMHYPAYFGGRQSIQPKVGGIDLNRLGNGQALTGTDISAVNYLYR